MINQEEINKYYDDIEKFKKSYEDICKVEILVYNDLTEIEQHIVTGEADIKALESLKTEFEKSLADSDASKKELLDEINELTQKIMLAHTS